MKNFAKIMALVVVVAMSVAMLAGCAPSDYKKAEANLKAADYTVAVVDDADALDIVEAGLKLATKLDVKIEATVTGTNGEESVMVYYFEDADSAKAFYDYAKSKSDESWAEIEKKYEDGKISEEDYNELKEEKKDSKLGKFGKVVYSGTAEAVKAL